MYERSNVDEYPKTFRRHQSMFMPFVYTAMDAACHAQTQMICAAQRDRRKEIVREVPSVGLSQLNSLPLEP